MNSSISRLDLSSDALAAGFPLDSSRTAGQYHRAVFLAPARAWTLGWSARASHQMCVLKRASPTIGTGNDFKTAEATPEAGKAHRLRVESPGFDVEGPEKSLEHRINKGGNQ
jgi:hypothetical protein